MSRWWCFPADDPWTNQHTQHWNTLNIFHLTWCGSSEQFENRLLRFTQHYWTNLGILSLTSRIQSILTLNSCLTVFLQQLRRVRTSWSWPSIPRHRTRQTLCYHRAEEPLLFCAFYNSERTQTQWRFCVLAAFRPKPDSAARYPAFQASLSFNEWFSVTLRLLLEVWLICTSAGSIKHQLYTGWVFEIHTQRE